MIIGLDFDNTIVCYDNLFHKVALEKDLIPETVPKNKVAVRDFMRGAGIEDKWTEMQGYVYGARMDEADPYPGVIEFIESSVNDGHDVTIISHKTQHPFIGPKYDLREAARAWIKKYINHGKQPLVDDGLIFFESTKKEKISRIAQVGPDFYVDDLPEILLDDLFPRATKSILFDPETVHASNLKEIRSISKVVNSWADLKQNISKNV